jgi:D-alanyl-D-alanine carboxypeptidase
MTRRKRKRGCLPGIITIGLFSAAVGYILFIAATQPERFTFRQNRQAAPAVAEAAYISSESDISMNPSENNPFSVFDFYIAEKQWEYENYQYENPALSNSDVVWHVNAGLNRPFFSEPNLVIDPNPLLVNPYNQLPEYFVPIMLEVIDGEGRLATPETVRAFRRMRDSAERDGHFLCILSAYRTIEHQRDLYAQAGGDGAVARPGFSEHHTGRALDLGGTDGLLDINETSDMGRWVRNNAHEYGFILRYTAENQHITGYMDEPWHITYVGERMAREMRWGGYGSLEEYTAKNPDAGLD